MGQITNQDPTYQATAFICPNCSAYSAQRWERMQARFPNSDSIYVSVAPLDISLCNHCRKIAVWWTKERIFPEIVPVTQPHADMPDSLRADYEEARLVFAKSPRSAAALLRLCIQKICIHLGEPGKNINDDIAALVAKGLPKQIQQALDIVRVIGNEQVHPGALDVRDDPALAAELFILTNFIVEDRIARPKAIQALYDRLPEDKRQGIERRDGGAVKR